MTGRIIKGIAGFYYVYVEGCGVYECKAKGVFRNRKVKPLVGDRVEIQVIDETEHKGNMEEILPRTSELIRPAVANVDQAMVIFAAAKPKPNLSLLDRFLISMEQKEVPSIICFNKIDEASEEELQRLKEIYGGCGSRLLFISARYEQGVEEIRDLLRGKTTTVAGPSGVGKSTLINLLVPDAEMETGQISQKIDRGKHTTRHSELFRVEEDSYIFDTPGFSSLELMGMEKEELRYYFSCLRPMRQLPVSGLRPRTGAGLCGKGSGGAGKINRERYESYRLLFGELQEKEKRRYN